MQLAIAMLERGIGSGGLFPAMPILFASIRAARTSSSELDAARAERAALEKNACAALERFLADTGSPAVVKGGLPNGTITRLDACLAGLIAQGQDPRARAWRDRLARIRADLAVAIGREKAALRRRQRGGAA